MKKRKIIKLSKMPKFNEGISKLPMPVEIDGRRKQWVGIGWVDEGPADGTEPTLIEVDD